MEKDTAMAKKTVAAVEANVADPRGVDKLRVSIVDGSGLTFVGYSPLMTDPWVTIRQSQCVVGWGVSHHLAELIAGPTKATRLGDSATVVTRASHWLASYEVTANTWTPVLSTPHSQPETPLDVEALRVSIVDSSGLTLIGYTALTDDDWLLIKDSACVVDWGVEAHLAQLCKGPSGTTKLGAHGDVWVRANNFVASYLIDETAWKRGCVTNHIRRV
jgi:hypothetical protein